MKPYRPLDTLKVEDSEVKNEEDLVAIESVFELRINGEFLASFICTPGFERELSVGHLLSTGVINSPRDIRGAKYSKHRCNIETRNGASIHLDRYLSRVCRVMNTKQSAFDVLELLQLEGKATSISQAVDVHESKIIEHSEILLKNQEIRSRTGATHGALVASLLGGRHVLAEDLGRHNAMDKVLGLAVAKNMNLNTSLAILSGRLTADVVSKCVWTGIPLLISFAVATDAGIKLARKWNLTLVGALHENGMRIYNTGAARLLFDK